MFSVSRLLLVLLFPLAAGAAEPEWPVVRPVLAEHCYSCHGNKKAKGGVNLERLDGEPAIGKEFEMWQKVKESIASGDMPPEEKPELKGGEKAQLLTYLGHSLETAMRANAGDPGVVTIRRLTNAEYDNTIRDLTGRDLGLARSFLPDGGGGEGFSNIGDVLFVSPQQLDKYLTAARKLVDQATILPGTGIQFQPQRVGPRGFDQLKSQSEQALYVWYQKMAAPYLPKDDEDQREGAYLLACWKWKHRVRPGTASLADFAKVEGLNPAFLENWYAFLNNASPASAFLDLTRVPWRELPEPDRARPEAVPPAVLAKVAEIEAQRKSWYRTGEYGHVQRMQQDADGLRIYPFGAKAEAGQPVHVVVGTVGDGPKGDAVVVRDAKVQRPKRKPESYFAWLQERLKQDQAMLAVPTTAMAPGRLQARIEEAKKVLACFGKHPFGGPLEADQLVLQAPVVFDLPMPDEPSVFRAAGQLLMSSPEVDFATVQWTATTGTPPDPTKILPGVLTMFKRQSGAADKLMHEFGLMKAAFPDEFLRRMEEVAKNPQRGGKNFCVYGFSDEQLLALVSPQERAWQPRMMTDWRLVRNPKPRPQDEAEWDGLLCGHVEYFAASAWRRPLQDEEKAQLRALYTDARRRELDRESAAREVLVRVLVSPKFLFKLEDASEPGEHRVDAWDFATRLSYLLWSSQPDDALRKAAADGSLFRPEVLGREVRRMLQDPRAQAFAREFAGQWLEFAGFTQHATVDAKLFPEFTPEVRAALYEETVTFITHIVQADRPVTELLTADYTFLNEPLAKFYGVPGVTGEEFRQVPVAQWHRGGILGMGSILTKTSYPNRTSPVLRGNWLLRSVLGTPVPPPPADVPELKTSGEHPATLRARLEQHRHDQACASCHDKIDPLGFALESFDAIGRWRTADESGLAVDTSAKTKDGTSFQGIDGLRRYLVKHQPEFGALIARKLLGYALGRTILPTDQPLLEQMVGQVRQNGGRFSELAVTLASSRQFQNRRND